MKRFVTAALTVICLVLGALAGLAVAAETAAADPSTPSLLADFIRNDVWPIVTPLVLGILSVVLAKIGQKFKIDALLQKNNIIEQLAYQGVTFAEEKASQLIGSKAALTSSQKADLAIGYVLKYMPKITQAQADAVVHSVLARIPGIGATGADSFSLDGLSTNFLSGATNTNGEPLSDGSGDKPAPIAAAPTGPAAPAL